MKLALNMIVKDDTEEEILYRCLSSIAPYVDGIYVTITNKPHDKIKDVIENFGGITSYYQWDKSFERARNYALDQVPEEYDCVIWCDADDVWVNPEKIPDILKIMEAQGLTGVFMDYNYEIDPSGKVNIVHPRERIIKRGYYRWKGHLHETLIPTKQVENGFYKDVKVNHFPLETAKETNLWRNLEILEKTYKEEGKNHDPRTEYYLARNYFDVEKYKEAEKLFKDYLNHSGWDEERAMAWNYLGLMKIYVNKYDEAIENFLDAIKERPQHPTWYVNMAYTYALMDKFEEATHYARLFINTPQPKSAAVYVPLDDEIHYYQTIYMVALGKRKIKEAITAAEELVKRVPQSEEYKKKLDSILRLDELVDITKGVEAITNELAKLEEVEKISTLLNGLPTSIQDNAYVEKLRQKYLPPKIWEEKSIVYFAGKSFEEWTPDSLKKGLGGSETAVVHLCKNWVRMGYKVTVYGNCGAGEGNYDGVEYLNYYRFNRYDTFNTLIIWRAPWELDFKWKANRVWLDLHDVPNPNEFTAERLKNVDRIFVKSKYHKGLLPHVPNDKFVVIPNGVDKRFAKIKGTNDKYKFIYASSYDRGLHWMLLWGWPVIKEVLPKATLDIYYGWNLFDAVHRNNPERMMWKKEMLTLMSQKGVRECGRVGQKELLKAKADASVHYYATDFEEIDCISVRESALVGCVPVMTDYAALKEKTYGVRMKGNPRSIITQEKIAKEIVRLIKTNEIEKYREEGKKRAFKENWEEVAKLWQKNL